MLGAERYAMDKKIRIILIIVLTAVLLFCVFQLIRMTSEYKKGQDSYTTLEQYVAAPGSKPSIFRPEKENEVPVQSEDTVWPEVDFAKLKGINEDIVGWIYIEDTDISYPVVKSDDNSYYLNHLFDKTRNPSGCIFLDMECPADFSGNHSIIHGHHMKDKSMFAGLVGYKEQKFYDEHPVALFLTPDARYKIHLFSGYVTDNWSSAWYKNFDEKDYASWLNEIKAKSVFESGAVPSSEDRVLTLSTCTYEFDDAKFVVHGYMEKVSGEGVPVK